MRKNDWRFIQSLLFIVVSALLLLSCSLTNNDDKEPLTASRDAAECIASSVGLNTGGALDQISDVATMCAPNGLKELENKYGKTYFVMTKSYDENTGIWSIHIERERGVTGYIPYAHFTRDYRVRFLNVLNQPQHYYIVDPDTARTVEFHIIRGTGRHQTRRISQQLDSLSASFTITNAHQANVTVNGTYYRAARDTIRGYNRTRISQNVLQLAFHDVVVPRNTGNNFCHGISGNVTGSFDADITFISGTAYAENHIHRDISIDFGSGKGNISFLTGKIYKADLYTGEVLD